ncbi:MAG: hypothetical protein ACNA7U_07790 [Candidatus Izemoplasmataceae bacterium]
MGKQTKGMTYFLFAMLAFGVLGLEFGVLFISRIIDGRPLEQLGQWPIHWYGAIAHWVITIIIWLLGAYLITLWAKKKDDLSQLVDVKLSKKGFILIGVAVMVVLIATLIEHLISGSEIPQVYLEYKGFVSMYGSYAWLVTISQVLYYAVEMLLVFIIIVLFQRFGEVVFKNKYIPYGSIGLMLTWGMIHFISHPAGALYITIWALVPGLLYIYGGKRFLPVYLLLLLGFII